MPAWRLSILMKKNQSKIFWILWKIIPITGVSGL